MTQSTKIVLVPSGNIQTFNIYVVQIARRVHTIKNLKYYVNF